MQMPTARSALPGIFCIVVTSFGGASSPVVTWLVQIDTTGPGGAAAVIPPRAGDIYRARLDIPFGADDRFSFTVSGQRVVSGGVAQNHQLDAVRGAESVCGSCEF